MYRSAKNDPYAQRLFDTGVPVSWIASKFAHRSLGTHANSGASFWGHFRLSKQIIRNGAQRVVTGMAGRNYEQCLDHLKQTKCRLDAHHHADPSAMVMIRAGLRCWGAGHLSGAGIAVSPA